MKFLSLLFFFVPFFSLHAQYELSICAIFKNEAPFLKEWIEFHKIQGVQHFYLYDDHSTDAFKDVLNPYMEKREVTLIACPFRCTRPQENPLVYIQKQTYMDAIVRFAEDTKWLALIDIDEFLFCPTGESLVSCLSRYEEFGGLVANWLVFGTSHLEELPEGNTLIESLQMCSLPFYVSNQIIKTIVRPTRVSGCYNAHHFQYKEPYFSVNAERELMEPIWTCMGPSICHHTIRINHYWTRTEKHFREEKIPYRLQRMRAATEESLKKKSYQLNKSRDYAIQQFVPELKRRLAK